MHTAQTHFKRNRRDWRPLMLALLPPAQTVHLTSRWSTATEGPLTSNDLLLCSFTRRM